MHVFEYECICVSMSVSECECMDMNVCECVGVNMLGCREQENRAPPVACYRVVKLPRPWGYLGTPWINRLE